MAGETQITVVGNLTDDPQLSFTPNGVAWVRFTIASTPRQLDRQSGQWRGGEPLFLRCSGWRDMAEHIAETLSKGTRVIVQGRLKQSRWEDKETGEKRSGYELDVDEVGPSLRFAQAKVTRMSRTNTNGNGSNGNGAGAVPVADEFSIPAGA